MAQAKRLQEAGFNEKQAEALRAAFLDVAAPYDISALATKADLATLKADLIQWIVALVVSAVVLNVFVTIGSMFGMAKLLGH